MNTPTATPWQHHPLGKIHFEPNKNMHLVCNPRENHSIAVAINENDARLIAAAPDLLAAAQCALADFEGILPEFDPEREHPAWETLAELRAAIIKATGETA